MRVLQLIASNGFYGAERVVALLSARLADLGCEITLGLFNASRMPQYELLRTAEQHGITVWDLPCRRRLDVQTVATLAHFLKDAEIDIVHTHGYKANLYGLAAARLTGCTAIATCHNWTDRTPALRRYGYLDKFVLRGFEGVVAVSGTVAATLQSSGFPATRLRIIPNGIDTAHFRNTYRQPGSEMHLVLGTLARLSEEKGVDVLVRALPRILAVYPDLQCVVAGDGPERAMLLALAAELGVGENFRLPGFCSDTAAFLAGCSIIVHPSRMDGMPLAILEAMAAGKPIVASAVGAIPMLLQGGRAGLLVSREDPGALADGVLRLIADKDLRERFAAESEAYAFKHFDAAAMGDLYLETYRELCRTLSPARPAIARLT